jgi:hypothetical protein
MRNTYSIPGAVVTEREHNVPLVHGNPVRGSISVFAREVAAPDGLDRPYLVFLQGGPGFEALRPTSPPTGWLARALADFRVLVARAHELGLKVMIDQVLSHTSDQHPWFKESRANAASAKADWYVWADAKDDGNPPNNWLSIFGGSAWQWDTRRCQYYFHNFLASQPDLNFHHPEVQEALLASVKFWLELGVDGYRLDTANFYFHDALLRDNPGRGRPTHGILKRRIVVDGAADRQVDHPGAMADRIVDSARDIAVQEGAALIDAGLLA